MAKSKFVAMNLKTNTGASQIASVSQKSYYCHFNRSINGRVQSEQKTKAIFPLSSRLNQKLLLGYYFFSHQI